MSLIKKQFLWKGIGNFPNIEYIIIYLLNSCYKNDREESICVIVIKNRKTLYTVPFFPLLILLFTILSIFPTKVSATETQNYKAIALGTDTIKGWDETNGYHYIWYAGMKWRVLDDQTNTGENGFFLLAETALDKYIQFYPDSNGTNINVWQNSSAKTWCETFANQTFSETELVSVLETKKSDRAFTGNGKNFVATENILNGDKVFFLSAEEAYNSQYGLGDATSRQVYIEKSPKSWWLRTAYPDVSNAVTTIYSSGNLYYHMAYAKGPVSRPAFNLSPENILFSSVATGGKSDEVGTLHKISEISNIEWKLTLKDESHKNFTVTSVEVSNNENIIISYKGAVVGNQEYISILLKTSDGELTHYGKIANVTSENGTVSFPISEIGMTGDMTLYIFNEQFNGDTQTDYASALKEYKIHICEDGNPTCSTPIICKCGKEYFNSNLHERTVENGFYNCCGTFEPAIYKEDSNCYEISNGGQFFWFMEKVNAGENNLCGKLANDIDLENRPWTPIGTETLSYSGIFDGNLCRIKNLKLENETLNYQGLFGVIAEGAHIKRVMIDVSCTIKGNNYVAGIVGGTQGSGKITIEQCGNEADIYAKGRNGAGILGANINSKADVVIQDCYNTGTVSGTKENGGISAWIGKSNSSILHCVNIGVVNNGDVFARRNGDESDTATFTNCYVLGIQDGVTTVTETELANGKIAYFLNDERTGEDIVWKQTIEVDSYPNFTGDIVEYNNSVSIYWSELSFTYSKGTWNPETYQYEGSGWFPDTENGGMITISNTGFSTLYASLEWQKAQDGVIDAELSEQEFLLAENEIKTVQVSLTGAPTESMTNEVLGSIVIHLSEPYIAYDAYDLYAWAEHVREGNYDTDLILAEDIYLTGENNWTSIGSLGNPYTGRIMGENKTIYGMNINISGINQCVGFIGCLGGDGEILNLTFENAVVNTSTTTNYVSIIAGRNYGIIKNCHVKSDSTVTGNYYVGGIAGRNENIIEACTSNVKASGQSAGSIVGHNAGTILE